MSEISCHNCTAACCKGPEIMELTAEELDFMEEGGNTLFTIAKPADHDRNDIPYPYGLDLSQDAPELLFAKDHPYEPLNAGLGRYMLLETCAYLETSPEGWERCSVYAERPAVCRNFEMAGHKCRLMRMNAGVDEPDTEFKERLKLLDLLE